MKRRPLLKAGAIGAGTILGAGCLSGGQGDDQVLPDQATFIIPAGAGGGFDAIGRITVELLEDTIDGLTMVPENVSGSNGVEGLNRLYDAEPNGETVGLVALPIHVADQFNLPGVQFDVRDMTLVGKLSEAIVGVVLSAADSNITSWDSFVQEARNRRVTFAVAGAGSADEQAALFLKDQHDLTELDIITATENRNEQAEALLRGDAELVLGSVSSYQEIIDSGDAQFAFALAPPGWSNAPEGIDIRAEQDGIDEVIYPLMSVLSFMAGPPDMDEAVVEEYRTGLQEGFDTERALEWTEETGRPLVYQSGEEAREEGLVESSFEITEQYLVEE